MNLDPSRRGISISMLAQRLNAHGFAGGRRSAAYEGLFRRRSGSRPLFNREVRHRIRRPDVLGPGAYEPVVVELLDDMRRPAGDPAQGEDGRIQVDVEAQGGVGRS